MAAEMFGIVGSAELVGAAAEDGAASCELRAARCRWRSFAAALQRADADACRSQLLLFLFVAATLQQQQPEQLLLLLFINVRALKGFCGIAAACVPLASRLCTSG